MKLIRSSFFKCASEDIFEHYVLRMDDEDIQV